MLETTSQYGQKMNRFGPYFPEIKVSIFSLRTLMMMYLVMLRKMPHLEVYAWTQWSYLFTHISDFYSRSLSVKPQFKVIPEQQACRAKQFWKYPLSITAVGVVWKWVSRKAGLNHRSSRVTCDRLYIGTMIICHYFTPPGKDWVPNSPPVRHYILIKNQIT